MDREQLLKEHAAFYEERIRQKLNTSFNSAISTYLQSRDVALRLLTHAGWGDLEKLVDAARPDIHLLNAFCRGKGGVSERALLEGLKCGDALMSINYFLSRRLPHSKKAAEGFKDLEQLLDSPTEYIKRLRTLHPLDFHNSLVEYINCSMSSSGLGADVLLLKKEKLFVAVKFQIYNLLFSRYKEAIERSRGTLGDFFQCIIPFRYVFEDLAYKLAERLHTHPEMIEKFLPYFIQTKEESEEFVKQERLFPRPLFADAPLERDSMLYGLDLSILVDHSTHAYIRDRFPTFHLEKGIAMERGLKILLHDPRRGKIVPKVSLSSPGKRTQPIRDPDLLFKLTAGRMIVGHPHPMVSSTDIDAIYLFPDVVEVAEITTKYPIFCSKMIYQNLVKQVAEELSDLYELWLKSKWVKENSGLLKSLYGVEIGERKVVACMKSIHPFILMLNPNLAWSFLYQRLVDEGHHLLDGVGEEERRKVEEKLKELVGGKLFLDFLNALEQGEIDFIYILRDYLSGNAPYSHLIFPVPPSIKKIEKRFWKNLRRELVKSLGEEVVAMLKRRRL